MQPNSSTRSEWIEQAQCRGMDVNLFYHERGENVTPEARDACNACSVKEQCAEWAIYHELHGYQGGLTAQQRRRIRANQNIYVWEPEFSFNTARNRTNITPKRLEKPIKHGTQSGYRMELKRGLDPCDMCLKAHRRYDDWNNSRRLGKVPDVTMPVTAPLGLPEYSASIDEGMTKQEELEAMRIKAYNDFLAS